MWYTPPIPMKRRLFTILSTVSLLLLLATVALRVRAEWSVDYVMWGRTGGTAICYYQSYYEAKITVGSPYPFQNPWTSAHVPIGATRWPPGTHLLATHHDQSASFLFGNLSVMSGRGDFAVTRSDGGYDKAAVGTQWSCSASWPLIFAATSALPVLWTILAVRRQFRRWYRIHHGLCLNCGYDLRASEERCPECGTPIPAQAASSGANGVTC